MSALPRTGQAFRQQACPLAETSFIIMRKADKEEITQAITDGIVFKKLSTPAAPAGGKVKTKARKKGYTTGAHGSGAAKKKADIRARRANRHKGK